MPDDAQIPTATPPPAGATDGVAPDSDTAASEQAERTHSARRSPFYALSYRNFRLFFIGQLISVAGTWMQTVAQQWLVYDLTKSASWLGIVSGASAIPYAAFAMWGGQVADRYSRRTTLVWTQTLAMVLAFVLAALDAGWWIPIQAWHIAALAGLSSVVNAFNMPAQQAFVVEMVDDRDAFSNAIALNSLRFNVARFLGPILAGIVLVKAGAAMCFGLNGLSFIAVIVSLLMMRIPRSAPQETHVSVWEGFTYIKTNRSVFRILLLIGVASLFAWCVSTLYPVFAADFAHRMLPAHGAGAAALMSQKSALLLSSIITANGIGAAIGGLFSATFGDHIARPVLVYGGAIVFCCALILFALAPIYGLALACMVVSGFAMITFAINANTRVQEVVPDALRGRVMAVYSLVFNGLFPVGGLEIGFLAERIHASHAVIVNVGVCFVATVALLCWRIAEARRAVPAGR